MKKILGTLLSFTAVLFVLTSCGSNPQDEFVSYMEKQSKQTEGTWDFKMGIDDLEMPTENDTAVSPIAAMMVTQLKDMSLSGTIKSSTKDNIAFDMDVKANVLGTEIPFHMVGDYGKEPKIYMATNALESIMGLVDSMAGSELSSQTDYSSLKGKYIDVMAMNETMDQATFDDLTKEMEAAQKNQAELQKKFTDYIKGLDKKTFTKDGDVLSHTFTKAEFQEILKIMPEVTEADSAELTKAFDAFDDFSMKINLDTKKDKTNVVFKMAPNASESETTGFKSITLSFEMTLKDKKANITLPKEADILTNEEVEAIFPAASAVGAQELTDEDFQEMKTALAAEKDNYDEATKKEILEMYKSFLSDEQYKEIEEALK